MAHDAMIKRSRPLLAVCALLAVASAPAAGQQTADVLSGIRNGGGWVSIPIDAGVGSVRTMTMPAMGMTLAGCLTVWPGHSGDFSIEARDNVSNEALQLEATPGEGVPFSHTFGMQAQVDFDFRWSEARDTTLLMWVGLAMNRTTEEACEPVYAR